MPVDHITEDDQRTESCDYEQLEWPKESSAMKKDFRTILKKKVQDLHKNIALVEMMYKTNVIVLVYEQQRNKVVIWDDHEKKNRTEITFNANQLIMNVKLRKDMMIVVLNEKAFIFNFVTLKLIEQVDTFPNPTGLCALSQAEKPISKIICLPAQEKGSLKVLNYGKYFRFIFR